MTRNKTTIYSAAEYDEKILTTLPFYDSFHRQTVDLVRSLPEPPQKWLDVGCGTGNLYLCARQYFPKTEFILADPSQDMLAVARGKTEADTSPVFMLSDSQSLNCPDNVFDVISAIQCHHYSDKPERRKAVGNCFRMLRPGGVFVVFENIRPLSEQALPLSLKRLENYQTRRGKTQEEARLHTARFDREYFPLSILEHLRLLEETGFSAAEILWASYLQAGFYAIK
ncbi:MAG: methyltransferase domain-containing protein [Methanimicrococcus sp.]|nr:methyltransferase domain-containing protein [Methanimicrococcus sp.]